MLNGTIGMARIFCAVLLVLSVHASSAFAQADEREALARVLEELERAEDPPKGPRGDVELRPFKQITLPNLFGFPDYRPLRVPVYRSKGTLGPGILLVHGNSSSARSYVEQVFSKLGDQVRLYLIDLPGFGLSEKIDPAVPLPTVPPGLPVGFPEYQIGLAEAVAVVAADPEVSPKVFVGWSLGGNVLLAARGLGLLPEARGFLIFGTAPGSAVVPTTEQPGLPPFIPGFPTLSTLPSFGLAFQLDPTSPLGFNLDGSFDDPLPGYVPPPIDVSATVGEAYLRSFFSQPIRRNGRVPDLFIEDGFVRADRRARASLGALAVFAPIPLPDELAVLRGLAGDPRDPDDDVPVAVLVGQDEALLNARYLVDLAEAGAFPTLWEGKIVEVPAAGHAIHYERPSIFNRTLLRFVIDLTDSSRGSKGAGRGDEERGGGQGGGR